MASLNRPIRSAPTLPPQLGVTAVPQRFETSNTLRTHEGAPAATLSPELALRRSVCSCLLWEDTHYESGVEIAARIADLASQVPPRVLADLAVDVRTHFHLRHAPLLLLCALAKSGSGSRLVSDTIESVIQRADELSEFVAIYAKQNGTTPDKVRPKLSAQVKKGLARAFAKFDSYQLAKYFSASGERTASVRGRDVMFLSHAKPKDSEQSELFRRIANREPIEVGGADTWEVALSSGADKRETWERLLSERKLGYLALLRNLRNMTEANVDEALVRSALLARRNGAHRVLPFRYIAAVRAAPQYAAELDAALRASIDESATLSGSTAILVDVSGSMNTKLSARSDLDRIDAAAALAAITPGDTSIFTFSDRVVHIDLPLRGLSLIDAIKTSQLHSGTHLGEAIATLNFQVACDRLIIITDEQSCSYVPAPRAKLAYLINVASYQHGVGYGNGWCHIDGFSESILRFIPEFEKLESQA